MIRILKLIFKNINSKLILLLFSSFLNKEEIKEINWDRNKINKKEIKWFFNIVFKILLYFFKTIFDFFKLWYSEFRKSLRKN